MRIIDLPLAEIDVVEKHDIMGGRPCVNGTRIPADTIIAFLKSGSTRFDILKSYPSLPVGGIEAVVRWAQGHGIDVQIPD
ncbi:MAG: DUF433 domain-containing protein [Sphingomonadaceae bacterium]